MSDPLCLRCYPLGFLAEMMTADASGIPVTALGALALLALLGGVGARLGGARAGRAALRVILGGGLG